MNTLTPIERLHFHPRAEAALVDNGVDFVEHLLLFTFEELLQLPGMGKALASNVQDIIRAKGKSLAPVIHPREKRRREFEEKFGQKHPEILAHS
jgi:hypothetical protein